MKGFTLGLALKQRRKPTRKSPIGSVNGTYLAYVWKENNTLALMFLLFKK